LRLGCLALPLELAGTLTQPGQSVDHKSP
jgi:hypothetical protein